MAPLERIAAVYRLLERVRTAEAMSASAAVAEVERGLEALQSRELAARLAGHTGVADPVVRTASQRDLLSVGVLQGRMKLLEVQRRADREDAAAKLAVSRLQRMQVEELAIAAKRTADLAKDRRTQAEDDDRYLARRGRDGSGR